MYMVALIAHSMSLRCLSVLLISMVFIVIDGRLAQALAQTLGEPGPEFQTYSIDGRYFSNESLEGERTLLMFWAPWCGVCRRDLPKLAQYYRDVGSGELEVVTIGTAASGDRVHAYVKEHPNTFLFPTVYDNGQLLKEAFGIRVFPTYVLLGEDGTIQFIHPGGGVLNNRKFQGLVE